MKSRLVVLIATLAFLLAACSSAASPSPAPATAAPATAAPTVAATPAPGGGLTIFAAASLKAVLAKVKSGGFTV